MQSLFRYLFIIENILTVFMNGHKNERNIGTHHRLISRHVKCGSTNIYCMTLATLILCLIVISIRYTTIMHVCTTASLLFIRQNHNKNAEFCLATHLI